MVKHIKSGVVGWAFVAFKLSKSIEPIWEFTIGIKECLNHVLRVGVYGTEDTGENLEGEFVIEVQLYPKAPWAKARQCKLA
jgi:hypothetical protein